MGNLSELDAIRQAQQSANGSLERLTPRQLEVLALMCEGLPNKLICRRLNIANGTVKVHVANILRALEVSSRLQAAIAAYSCGLEFRLGDANGMRPLPPSFRRAVRSYGV